MEIFVKGNTMPFSLQIMDSLDRVFHDTQIPSGGKTQKTVLSGPRGGGVSFQLACDGLAKEPKFSLNNIRLPYTVRRILYVPVEANTSWDPIAIPVKDRKEEKRSELFIDEALDSRMRPNVVKAAPFEVAEVLAPLGTRKVESNRPTVFYVSFNLNDTLKPGILKGTLNVDSVQIPLEIHVSRLQVPKQQALKVTNWFNLENVAKYHHLKMWSPAWWGMLRKYARLMREYRQNVFWVPSEVFVEIDKKGKVKFDWDRFDRYVKLFLAEGFAMIEGCHFSSRKQPDNPGLGLYTVLKTSVDSLSLEGRRYIQEIASSLWNHLQSEKWDRMYVQHVADEPAPAEAPVYLAVANLLRKSMPGVKLIDAILGTPAVQGMLDIHVPNIADLHIPGVDRDAEFDKLWNAESFRKVARDGGGEFWFYTCCGPRGPAMNRFLDFPLIKTRLLHWLNFLEGATGYLHWGLNMYLDGQDPFKKSVNKVGPMCHCLLPPGDMHIVWPGEDGPWPSLRFEAMREGIVDYELLRANKSKAIARRMVRSLVDYVTDTGEFRRVYRKLLNSGFQIK
jgi:hypothetical protein